MAHAYAHLFEVPATGLRFFTVYGPWGRPDMALSTFTRKILAGEPLEIFNNGDQARDFSYVDDVVEGVLRVADRAPASDPGGASARYRIYNVGNAVPVPLMDFIGHIESAVGRTAEKHFLPAQPEDLTVTCADQGEFSADFDFTPATPIDRGVENFVAWYRDYYQL